MPQTSVAQDKNSAQYIVLSAHEGKIGKRFKSKFMEELIEIGKKAKKAAGPLAVLNTEKKNQVLSLVADLLEQNTEGILEANARDLKMGAGDGTERSHRGETESVGREDTGYRRGPEGDCAAG